MIKIEELLKEINERIEKPFITARFGDNWKEHTKKMINVGQIDLDMLLDIAWKNGRKVVLMEEELKKLIK